MAAIKAGYSPESAHVKGSRMLRNDKVRNEILRLEGKMREDIFIDAMDVLNKYIKIAFSDITDYVTYGKKEVSVMGAFGPVKIDGKELKQEVNYVDFKESYLIDGTIIEQASQGKHGIKIKLCDKMRALEKLEKYFDLFPDKFKREIESEKLKIAKAKAYGDDSDIEDDGFMDALNATSGEVWTDGEED